MQHLTNNTLIVTVALAVKKQWKCPAAAVTGDIQYRLDYETRLLWICDIFSFTGTLNCFLTQCYTQCYSMTEFERWFIICKSLWVMMLVYCVVLMCLIGL